MILVFLGSWRSTLIIAVSIPLSILTSIIVLSALGETINIMTLGGLALAVGILVDDATVEIENINRNIDQGKEIVQAILDGAQQIAVPALVSTLSICIVFVPMFFLSGVARYLFVPLAEAVCFGVPHATWGEEVEAAVVLRLETPAGEADLIAFCRGRLADFKCPKKIHLVASIPRTATGKIQRLNVAAELAGARK